MPISNQPGYEDGHFGEVYEDLIKPAVVDAGYVPVRADDVAQTNIIHEDILRRLLESPLAVCDLSARNPNVLFELGLRQAFDKPTVLLRDDKTPEVFDVGPLRYIRYGAHLGYRDVPRVRDKIVVAIGDTMKANEDGTLVNSLVRLLQLSKAAELPEAPKVSLADVRDIIRSEMHSHRDASHYLTDAVALRDKRAGDIATLIALSREMATAGRITSANKRLSTVEKMLSALPSDDTRKEHLYTWWRKVKYEVDKAAKLKES